MSQSHRPIQVFFHHHMRGAEMILHLIELSFMRNGEILPQTPGGLEAETPYQNLGCWPWPMQIGGLRRDHSKAPVVAREILLQKVIRRLHGCHPGQAHLFDQPILQRLKQPFHPPLGLRRVGCDELDA